jgi:HlyD family secretion protein
MKKRIPIIIAIIVVAAAFAGYKYTRSSDKQNANTLKLSGNIETIEAEVSFKIAGRLEKRLVDEGDTVKAGQLVAVIDSTELQDQVRLQRAQANAAQEDLRELVAGSRPEEIASGEAALAQAQADEQRLRADRERYTFLYKKELISTQAYDAAVTAHEVAVAKVRDASERLTLLRKGPREEKIAQARARLDSARQSLAVADTRLGYVTVNSPTTGVVLAKHVEPGEYVSAGTPIVTVGQMDKVWLRAYVDETDLGRVKLGQSVCVTTDTYPGRQYLGRIGFISSEAEFTPKMVQTQKERVKLVYRIKIDIDNPNMDLKPGMPADATIQLAGDAPCTPSAQKN